MSRKERKLRQLTPPLKRPTLGTDTRSIERRTRHGNDLVHWSRWEKRWDGTAARKYPEEVSADEKRAVRLGIHAVPACVTNRQRVVTGVGTLEELVRLCGV